MPDGDRDGAPLHGPSGDPSYLPHQPYLPTSQTCPPALPAHQPYFGIL